ncbi:hypothetical protein IAQ61_005525 [Plenodomus lingam]|uniref:uncharacterized protein n=1 Tax=Leptosphaeria maculans TaxID=5022 RepID=UPI003333B45D|nr:hypothetical protein IAQ61_005525 [Plenodomus lingam]
MTTHHNAGGGLCNSEDSFTFNEWFFNEWFVEARRGRRGSSSAGIMDLTGTGRSALELSEIRRRGGRPSDRRNTKAERFTSHSNVICLNMRCYESWSS